MLNKRIALTEQSQLKGVSCFNQISFTAFPQWLDIRRTKLNSKATTFSQTETKMSNEFCQARLATLKFWGFLEYMVSKLENVSQFFQLSILFHLGLSAQLSMTKPEFSLRKRSCKIRNFSVSVCFHWFYKAVSPNLREGEVLGSIFARYVLLASQNPYFIMVHSVGNYRTHLSHFWANVIFAIPT